MIAAPPAEVVTADVAQALAEDVGSGDLTANLVDAGTRLKTRVIAREPATLAGRPWFDETFRQLDDSVVVDWRCQDGECLTPDQVLCTVDGLARSVLTGERTALNFLQCLSGTATRTARYVAAAGDSGVRLLDTRKTLPGLRRAQKYAVRCGGGHNHRIGLFDAILIKENHIAASGGITGAVQRARELSPGVLVEVEVETLEQLEEALAAGADRALLDNFDLGGLRQAVHQINGQMELEASGNVTLDTMGEVAATGVDFISVGALTKHVRAVDFSMRFEPPLGH